MILFLFFLLLCYCFRYRRVCNCYYGYCCGQGCFLLIVCPVVRGGPMGGLVGTDVYLKTPHFDPFLHEDPGNFLRTCCDLKNYVNVRN